MLTALTLDEFIDTNYNKLRKDFEDELVHECWYLRFVAENTDDWRDDFVEKEYWMYVMDCESVNKKLVSHMIMKGHTLQSI